MSEKKERTLKESLNDFVDFIKKDLNSRQELSYLVTEILLDRVKNNSETISIHDLVKILRAVAEANSSLLAPFFNSLSKTVIKNTNATLNALPGMQHMLNEIPLNQIKAQDFLANLSNRASMLPEEE